MKDAFREKAELLTSHQIAAIRAKYGVSQNELSLLLGWSADAVSRYESHQVQDTANDTVLRRLDADPQWFGQLIQGLHEEDALAGLR